MGDYRVYCGVNGGTVAAYRVERKKSEKTLLQDDI